MVEKHKLDGRGRPVDDVDMRAVSKRSLQQFDDGRDDLRRHVVPILLRREARHDRLFMANFDGTGNDVRTDPEHMTNIGRFALAAESIRDPRFATHYLPGPGTQALKLRKGFDAATGRSLDSRVEEMYEWIAIKAAEWIAEDPDAEIRVLVTGFSRGAEQAAVLTRIIHERGIVIVDSNGHRRQLVEPGKVAQSIGLFDPVGTGHPHSHDRVLAPSVVSGFQIVARDERRTQFPVSMIIPQGISEDGRFLGITVPGSHSDVGGSYHADGLARASEGLMVDYISSQIEGPSLQRRPLSSNISDYDDHKSEQHSFLWTTGAFRRLGERDVVGAERHPQHCRPIEACSPPERADLSLLNELGPRHPVTVGETPLDLIGRDIAVDTHLKPGDAEHPLARQAPDAGRTRAEMASRDLAPDASWVDYHRSIQRDTGERDNRIDFSRFPRLDSHEAAHESAIRFQQSPQRSEGDEALRGVQPDRSSPTHPAHRDHALYNSVHDKLTTLHAEEGIKLTDEQMDRLAHCSVATAKQCRMADVSHVSLGQDRQGNLLPEVHLYEAFRGELDDPRTKWGKVEALEAFQTPVEAASRDLQVANQQMDQFQQDQQMRMAQQQEQGMSMSR